MSAFDIISGASSSTVVLHVPHSSTWIPDEVRTGIVLTDEELAAELRAITDADTDLIACGAAELAAVRPWTFVNRASRLVVDPERFPDDREELNAVGMGAVYERTTQGQVLRAPGPAERQDLIERFFAPYSDGIAALVRERLAAVGRVTIIDIHSYPLAALPYELHADGQRPEVCVGTDGFHTAPELREHAVAAMGIAAPTGEVGRDSPFIGCYVPLDQYGINPLVQAVMLEIRRDLVSNDIESLFRGTATLIDSIDNKETS